MENDKEERRSFQVKDRRRFSESGEARDDVADEGGQPSAAPPPPAAEAPHADEPVTFSTFVLGLSTQALFHLGEIPDPASNTTQRDLGAAKHVIDILALL